MESFNPPPEYRMFSEFAMDLETLNNQAILLAAKEGQSSLLFQLITHTGVNPNFTDMSGSTDLAEAASYGHTEAIMLLLKLEGIDVNTRDEQQRAPLLRAIENHHTEISQILINTPSIDCAVIDSEGRTPMSLAVKTKQSAVVQLLLQRCDLTRIDWETLALLSIEKDDTGLFFSLLTKASFDDLMGISSIQQNKSSTVDPRHASMLAMFTEVDAAKINTYDQTGRTLLTWAIERWQHGLAQELIKMPVIDLSFRDGRGDTPRTTAVKCGNKEMVTKLYYKEVNVKREVNTKRVL